MFHCILFGLLFCFNAPPAGADLSEDDSPLIVEGTVDADVEDVWKAFTTREGLESWMVPKASIELKIGGKMMTTYDPKGVLGDEDSIENTILSYDPKRMLSIKATRVPKTFPFKNAAKNTWSVLYFEPAGPGKTKVRVVGLGYRKDEESQKMKEFFKIGNAYTIRKLSEKFAKK